MGRRIAVARPASELRKDLLKLTASRNDNSDVDGAKLEQEPEVIEVSIEERILVVPLDFQRHSVFETVNLVRRRGMLDTVDNDLRIERFLAPPKICEMIVDLSRNERFAAARLENMRLEQAKFLQDSENVSPFSRPSGSQNGKSMPPLMDFVPRLDVFRYQSIRHSVTMHARIGTPILEIRSLYVLYRQSQAKLCNFPQIDASYSSGDCRIICRMDEGQVLVLVLAVCHRREIYD